ncbi:MAG: hypothetical protein LQ342_008307 [Letrouitia transgressa]|nr:MAG: hypothetical protein LQ342_008307 [Letrouitia transgressa]
MPKVGRPLPYDVERCAPYAKSNVRIIEKTVKPRSKPKAPAKSKPESQRKPLGTLNSNSVLQNPKPSKRLLEPPAAPSINWRKLELEEEEEHTLYGEVPIWDSAATVRRKLSNLIRKKDVIPGPDNDKKKKWTQAAVAAEMQGLEDAMGQAKAANCNCNGPSARSLGIFLKKTGETGGADSACYYWGYVMLEKLRMYKGEEKSKARLEAEEEYVADVGLAVVLECLLMDMVVFPMDTRGLIVIRRCELLGEGFEAYINRIIRRLGIRLGVGIRIDGAETRKSVASISKQL